MDLTVLQEGLLLGQARGILRNLVTKPLTQGAAIPSIKEKDFTQVCTEIPTLDFDLLGYLI